MENTVHCSLCGSRMPDKPVPGQLSVTVEPCKCAEDQEVNAKLIAAAPDLLDSCKAVLIQIEDDPKYSMEKEMLESVITKATT